MKRSGWLVAVAVTALLVPATMSYAVVNNDEVTSQKIREADGTSGQNTNSGSGVKTGHIQNGAVTDAKIAGPISASKIEKRANVIVVAKSGGDFTTIQDAINSISPNADNPYVIKVMPGTYLGRIDLKSYIDLQGSGKDVTVINNPSEYAHAVVMDVGTTNIAISGFTITGAATGIYSVCNSDITIKDNLITGISAHGIYAIESGATITRNTIANNGTPMNGVSGIIAVSAPVGMGCPVANAKITENVLTGNSQSGVYAGLTAAPSILRNIITGNGYFDVQIDSTSTPNVSFNVYDTIQGGRGLGQYNVKSDGSPAPAP